MEGNVLPDPETTASMREHNNVELEYYMAGLQRQLTAIFAGYVQTAWGSLQRALVHELQVALNAGAILQWMVSQAMLYARGMAPPNCEDPYPPLNPGRHRGAGSGDPRFLFFVRCIRVAESPSSSCTFSSSACPLWPGSARCVSSRVCSPSPSWQCWSSPAE